MPFTGGVYQWRRRGERHKWNPETIAKLQAATRANDPQLFAEYERLADEEDDDPALIRGLLEIDASLARPVPLDEVEPASEIVKRFVTGAMSFGSISCRGARAARHRHEPHGGALEQRRRRRGGPPVPQGAQRRLAAQRHQAGRLGALRGHHRVPGQRRRAADQGGPGRQAGRRRPAARSQGGRADRQGALVDAGRDADLPAAAPRHLLHRGSRPAHLRPAVRQPGRARQREAGERGRRRHDRRGRGQGRRGRGDHLGLRGRHGRFSGLVDQTRRACPGSWAWPRRSRCW